MQQVARAPAAISTHDGVGTGVLNCRNSLLPQHSGALLLALIAHAWRSPTVAREYVVVPGGFASPYELHPHPSRREVGEMAMHMPCPHATATNEPLGGEFMLHPLNPQHCSWDPDTVMPHVKPDCAPTPPAAIFENRTSAGGLVAP